jgi:hypothetical protein
MWCSSFFDHSLFSIGLLALLYLVLISSLMSRCLALGCWQCFMWCLFSLMSRCSALGYWQCFMWCLFSFDESLFSLGLLAVLHVVLAPSLSSPVQLWGNSHAPSGLVKCDINEILSKNTV